MEYKGIYFNRNKADYKDKVGVICLEEKNKFYYVNGRFYKKYDYGVQLELDKEIFFKVSPLEMVRWENDC